MKKDLTAIFILMDGSGSMDPLRTAVVDGINEFIITQRKVEGEVVLSMAQFDSNYETFMNNHGLNFEIGSQLLNYKLIYDFRNLKEIALLTRENYVPSGGTPLRDAMSKSIDEFGAKLAAIPEEYRPEKVIFLTFTDGQENSSKNITQAALVEKIKHQQSKYGWKFIYLGSNHDSWAAGTQLGIKPQSIMNYDHTYGGTLRSLSAASGSITSYRVGTTKDVILTDEDTTPKVSPSKSKP